jgi:hypothetical protein
MPLHSNLCAGVFADDLNGIRDEHRRMGKLSKTFHAKLNDYGTS